MQGNITTDHKTSRFPNGYLVAHAIHIMHVHGMTKVIHRCIIGAPDDSQPPLTQTPSKTSQFIELIFYHDKLPITSVRKTHLEYNPPRSHPWELIMESIVSQHYCNKSTRAIPEHSLNTSTYHCQRFQKSTEINTPHMH